MGALVETRARPGGVGTWWGTVGIAMLGTGALAGGVADDVLDADGATHLDQPVLDWMLAHRSPGLSTAAIAVTDAGGTPAMVALALLAVGWLLLRGRRAAALLVTVASLGAAALVVGIKGAVGRPRPPLVDQLVVETNASFPSGHTLGSTVVIGVVAAVVVARAGRASLRVAVVAVAVSAVVAVGLSRLYLGVHWTTDVLEGWLLGGFWLALCLAGAMWWRQRSPGPTGVR